jgi:hypothetical protein
MDTTTSTKKQTEKKFDTESAKAQEQVLDAIRQSQDATLQFVQAWSEGVTNLTSNLPELPKLPTITALPKPEELSDQFFSFAQKLVSAQQEFVKKLIAVLPTQDLAAK